MKDVREKKRHMLLIPALKRQGQVKSEFEPHLDLLSEFQAARAT